jgi:hypothetical protein
MRAPVILSQKRGRRKPQTVTPAERRSASPGTPPVSHIIHIYQKRALIMDEVSRRRSFTPFSDRRVQSQAIRAREIIAKDPLRGGRRKSFAR